MKVKNLFIGILLAVVVSTASYAVSSQAIVFYNKGIDLTNQKNYKGAIESFEQALEVEPSFIDAYYNLGILQEHLGNDEKAIQAFESIISYKKDDYEAVYKVATLYKKIGDQEKTLAYIKMIPPEDPHYEMITEVSDTIQDKTFTGFSGPTGIARDSKGVIYVANFMNNSIISVDKDGEKTTIAQNGLIKGPVGLAIDEQDNIYVANYEANNILMIPAEDRIPKELPFEVNQPYFLMIDNLGVLYISEQGSNSVSQYNLLLEREE